MKYEFMDEQRERFKLKNMCRVLKVSRSGYYAWRSRIPSERQRANEGMGSSMEVRALQQNSMMGG
jgi:hypothetical protein